MEIKQIDDVESDEKRVVLQRNIIQINGKRALVLAGARVLFYPTLLYNLFRNKIQPEFRWWDQVDQFLLLGAVPFPKDVPRLKHLGVHGVVTLNESYETFVPTSLYQAYDIEHLVIPTRDYLFAPSLVDISRAVDFIHSKFFHTAPNSRYEQKMHHAVGPPTFTAKLAGVEAPQLFFATWSDIEHNRFLLFVKYKKMTPRAALEYVREKRPRVLLAAEQWKAVQEYGKQHSNQIETSSSLSIGDEVLVTETDLEGYQCPNNAEANRPMKQPRTSKTIISKLTCIFSALKPFGGTKTITFHGLPEVRAY